MMQVTLFQYIDEFHSSLSIIFDVMCVFETKEDKDIYNMLIFSQELIILYHLETDERIRNTWYVA